MTKGKGNIFGNIKERILQVGDYYSIGRKNICELIGMTYGNFTGKAKDTPINSVAIQNIIANYPMIDANWLLTGQGEMLREEDKITSNQKRFKDEQSDIVVLLKELLKEKDVEIKSLNQEIGALKLQLKGQGLDIGLSMPDPLLSDSCDVLSDHAPL